MQEKHVEPRPRDNAGMQTAFFDRALRACLAGLLAVATPAGAPGASRKSPHVEILGQGTVATVPRQSLHKNGRRFLEFEITLSSARPTDSQPAGADLHLALDTSGRVRVVHDLSCGGETVVLAQGDRIQIQGEYVHVPKGGDLIHFTHAADGSCGRGSKHPNGFLRKLPAAAAGPGSDASPRPAALVPEQPYTGPPPAGERPYAAIVAAKAKGASNAELLAKVEREHMPYSLTTPEIQKLRAAGVSEAVIEAMLRSGRAQTPAGQTPAPAPTPR
jgi:hypothetical protein